jgi:hypothetical protein
MRIWTVPYGELDDKRILGQHREIHMWAAMGIHASEADQIRAADIHEQTLAEMRFRGFLSGHWHETPLPGPQAGARQGQGGPGTVGVVWNTGPGGLGTALGMSQTMYQRTEQQLAQQLADRIDLVGRWQGIYKGRVAMPEAYEPLLNAYWEAGGCLHDGRTSKLKDGRVQCLKCKRALLVNGVWIDQGKWFE